ncbi:MAG: FHA domain-containing protein [Acidobacteria bacterium]|nr:FHA domain-containing protein [Acidobacteriota bacterium]
MAADDPDAETLKDSMWVLRSTPESAGPQRTFRIPNGVVRTLGRAVRADFILDATMVSRLHCRLTASRDGPLEVVDLDSTNGTFVNGRRVEKATLKPGDRLKVGRVELFVTRSEKRKTKPS